MRWCSALTRAGVIAPELAHRLAGAIGLRNRIAHQYDRIDLGLVFAAARDELTDLEAFAAAAVGA